MERVNGFAAERREHLARALALEDEAAAGGRGKKGKKGGKDDDDALGHAEDEGVLAALFLFTLTWSVGGNLDDGSRDRWNAYVYSEEGAGQLVAKFGRTRGMVTAEEIRMLAPAENPADGD